MTNGQSTDSGNIGHKTHNVYFIFVFVFVIDDNDTQADEAHIMCLKTSNENKNSTVYLVLSCCSLFP
jgi:hypothetical protein